MDQNNKEGKMIYRAEIRECHVRNVYVEADSAEEARRLAQDPASWWDADEPDTLARITVYTNSVSIVDNARLRKS